MSASIALTWRRAWNGGVGHSLPGDLHLVAVLRFHREAERIGVLRTVRSSSAEELVEAKSGYAYLGITEIVATIERAQRILRNGEELGRSVRSLDTEYHEILSDDKLFSNFRICYRTRPAEFSSESID